MGAAGDTRQLSCPALLNGKWGRRRSLGRVSAIRSDVVRAAAVVDVRGLAAELSHDHVGRGAGRRTISCPQALRLFSYEAKGELAAPFAELNVLPRRCC